MIATAPRIITKYANRRLYDTVESRYITLEELARLIRAGARIRVQDARDGTDLTRQVLTQVVLEEPGRLDILPVELLHFIIQSSGTVQAGALQRFLAEASRQFGVVGDTWMKGVAAAARSPGMEVVEGAVREVAEVGAEFLQRWMGGGAAGGGPETPPPVPREDREPAERPTRAQAGVSPPGEHGATEVGPPPGSTARPGGSDGSAGRKPSPDLDAVRDQVDSLLRRLRGGPG